MPKKLSILGSTGKVGSYVLEVIDQNPDEFEIIGLSSYGNNLKKIVEQIKKYQPEVVSIYDPKKAIELRKIIGNYPEILQGEDGNIAISTQNKIDGVVTSLTGSAGIKPTYEAIEAGKEIYLANKETLVVAGDLITKRAKDKNVNIIPLDDEAAGIFQLLRGKDTKYVEKIMLSCSGGPFYGYTREQLENVKVEEALKHPKFVMGPKISIESAILWNKAAEIIQVKYLFNLEPEKINVFVHPEAIVHAKVFYIDGTVHSAEWLPSTKYAISYALHYPKRMKNNFERIDLFDIENFTFKKPNYHVFPCLKYGYDALKKGGSMPAAVYYASDVATDAFAKGEMGILDVEKAIKHMLDTHKVIESPTLEDLLELENPVKKRVKKFLGLKQ